MGKDDTDGSTKTATIMEYRNDCLKMLTVDRAWGGDFNFCLKNIKKMNSSNLGQNKSKSLPGVLVVKFPSNPLPALICGLAKFMV